MKEILADRTRYIVASRDRNVFDLAFVLKDLIHISMNQSDLVTPDLLDGYPIVGGIELDREVYGWRRSLFSEKGETREV